FPFVVLGSEELEGFGSGIMDKEKYDTLNDIHPTPTSDNPDLGYKVLKNITADKVVLTRTVDGEERTLILEKREETTEIEFLQIDQKQELIDLLSDSSIDNYWEITTLKKGTTNYEDRFKDVKFTFESPVEGNIRGFIYDNNDDVFDNRVINTPFFKSSTNNDLLFPFVVLGSEELEGFGSGIMDKEKYDTLNDIHPTPTSDNPDLGYKVLKNITADKVVLTRTVDGEEITLILEKK
ncbi:hypothetical protein, partial [Aquimarina algicola]|uniref:hypothetical protein n=1 Tax=Aquimarina algicola TaxID=2589995 RepID=UPI001CF1817B